MNEQDAANLILDAVGRDNIETITHCATRIRIVPKDEKKIKKIEENELLKGTLYNGDQFQIFVNLAYIQEVFDALISETENK